MDENMQLCRICISNSECATMIPIFGEDLLWKKITMLADVKIEKEDTLPQQVCLLCAKATISACMFKKKCEDADNFFRHHLQMMRKMELLQRTSSRGSGDVITISEGSDNDDIMNIGSKHVLSKNNLPINGGGGASNESQMTNKNNYDLDTIRMMMNNYLIEQQNKEADAMAMVNGYHQQQQDDDDFQPPPCDISMDEDQLPLIPEIELITPNDEGTEMMDSERQTIVHNQDQGYQCSICYQIFVRKFLLKDHMHNCHGVSPPVYECLNCNKSYLYKRFLEKHVRRGRCAKKRRNQTRPMECTDCHVLFPTGHHLGWHKRTGCPSRTSKVPLQQLLKRNIVQYNNFPKSIIPPPLTPDNALYLQNKSILPNSKRKGRTRIKLDSNKIALAKMLILKNATTTQIAQELDISRTFAWRLRKNLVNGVSLDERFVNQSGEEKPDSNKKNMTALAANMYKTTTNKQIRDQQTDEIKTMNADENAIEIKQEIQDEQVEKNEEDDDDEEDSDSDTDSDSDSESDSDSNSDDDDDDDEADQNDKEMDNNPNKSIEQQSISQGGDQVANYENGHNRMQQQIEQNSFNGMSQTVVTETAADNQSLMQNENAESESEDGEDNEDEDDDDDDDDENDDEDDEDDTEEEEEERSSNEAGNAEAQMQIYQQQLMQTLPSVYHIPQQGFPQPVNLSIKSLQAQNTNLTPTTKKPRKPNVFIDDEKYARAKILVSQNSSTMEIARQLNVSQMTAWKLRDAIVKGVPLSYRSKRESRPKPPEKQQKPVASSTPKEKLPRRRLKAAERELRDREITREILEMIKEDSNIQYWKISAKLAEKGYIVSPSSVCQKLKALGIHRRWKPGDKPPILDMGIMKTNSNGGGGSAVGGGTSTDSYEFNNEQQFELGGAHFLSAFTH